jgi:hypothetical protein
MRKLLLRRLQFPVLDFQLELMRLQVFDDKVLRLAVPQRMQRLEKFICRHSLVRHDRNKNARRG